MTTIAVVVLYCLATIGAFGCGIDSARKREDYQIGLWLWIISTLALVLLNWITAL